MFAFNSAVFNSVVFNHYRPQTGRPVEKICLLAPFSHQVALSAPFDLAEWLCGPFSMEHIVVGDDLRTEISGSLAWVIHLKSQDC